MVSRSIKAGATSEECDVRVFLINLAGPHKILSI